MKRDRMLETGWRERDRMMERETGWRDRMMERERQDDGERETG